ncbi:MAG: DUF4838 domain-containing protein [Abditibacteriota bacterium]|nr:DUF4838 domain-containing protein [Abditibacteriota bacterium]
MKIALLFFIITLSAPVFAFDLIKDGKPNATVIISNDMTAPEVNAANEFIEYIGKITSVTLKISTTPTRENNIYFGQTQKVKDLTKYDFSTLGVDGIYIKSGKDYLIFSGDRPRGTLYAVYTFLEDNLGCCFYSPTEEYIPKKDNINLDNINIIYTPPFEIRESYFRINLNRKDYKFFVKNKLNGFSNIIPEEWGDHAKVIGWAHTIPQLIPVSKYGKEHPEWFALVNGKRDVYDTSEPYSKVANICFSNKEVIDELTKVVLEKIGDDHSKVIITVSQPGELDETDRRCHCEDCLKLYDRYGNSGAFLTVVNHVAKEAKKKNPNAYIDTFAYKWTRQAPKNIKPEDNVIVFLCGIECDFATPIDSETNKDYYKDFQDWKKLTDNIYIWDYAVNYLNSHPLFPNFHILQDNIKIYANNNIKAIMAEGDDYNYDTALISLKAYLIDKLLWNPNADVDKLTKQYLDLYFGPAGEDVYNYLNIITKAVQREKIYLKCFNKGNTFLNEKDYMDAFTALYNGYMKVKDNDTYTDRLYVQIFSLQFSVWQAPEEVQEKVKNTGILDPYETKEKFLEMYIPFSISHKNAYGQYGIHINNSELYKY